LRGTLESDALDGVLTRLDRTRVEIAVDRVNRIFDPSRGGSREIVIFGAAELGRRILAAARSAGLDVVAFADNAERRRHTAVDGVPVLPPVEAAERFRNSAAFVIAVYNSTKVREQLAGLACERTASFPEFFWSFSEFVPGLTGLARPQEVFSQLGAARAAYGLLGDAVSRREFAAQLEWRCTLDPAFLPPPSSFADMHFDQTVYGIGSAEVVVDCGAFDGDSLRAFLTHASGRMRRYYALEPDPSNREALSRYVATLPDALRFAVVICGYAASSHNGTACFDAGLGVSSTISAGGANQVECRRLDELVDLQPTLIKMDIEGAEPDALRGAAGLIGQTEPVLSICAYHSCAHLWELPALIHELAPNHQILLRRYAEDCWETVYYAVPPARRFRAPQSPRTKDISPAA
jgi:FkbM family methyltransferase